MRAKDAEEAMLVIAGAIILGLLVFVAITATFGAIAAILPALATSAVVYFFVARNIGRQMEVALQGAQKELMKGPRHIDKAVQQLEQVRDKYAKLQIFSASSLNGQIGMIHFMRQDFDKARPYLQKAFVRLWNARAMLAVLEYKKKNMAEVDSIMEQAARYNKKQGLLWSLWAYLHWKSGDADKAISILNRGKEAVGDTDETLLKNLNALQNRKKMKMKGYGEQWYQFQLEEHPQVRQAKRGGNIRFARR